MLDPVELGVVAVSKEPVVTPSLCDVKGPLPYVMFVGSYQLLGSAPGAGAAGAAGLRNVLAGETGQSHQRQLQGTGTGGSGGGSDVGGVQLALRVFFGEGDQFASWADVDLGAVQWAMVQDVP